VKTLFLFPWLVGYGVPQWALLRQGTNLLHQAHSSLVAPL